MAEPENMILPLLREIQTEALKLRETMMAGFARIDVRCDALERKFDSIERKLAALDRHGRHIER